MTAVLEVGQMFIGVGLMIFFIAMSMLIYETLGLRKSTVYRKNLSDLYVAAKIRQIADKDSVDLNEENENFKKWSKKQRMSGVELDAIVEMELQEKITESKKEKKTE